MARRRARFVRSAPRTKMWIGQGVGETSVGASAKVFVSSLSAGALFLRPFTILRTHMLITVYSDQSTAIETTFGAFGKIVVTDTAAAIGVTAVPDPSGIAGDPEADWYVWQALQNRFFIDIDGAAGVGVDSRASQQYVIDSKAMRKVGPDDNEVSMVSNDAAVGFILTTIGRQLIQLH